MLEWLINGVKGVPPKKASKLLNNFSIETYCDLGNPPMKKKPLILNAWKLREIMWNNHVTIMSRAGIYDHSISIAICSMVLEYESQHLP